jgi:beta-aspartyl-peptidase (threonine type)
VYGLGFKPVVVVHGGAGIWRGLDLDMGAVVKTLKEAVMIGLDVSRSGSCLDMVVEAIAFLEDSGLFNAGVGSVLDYVGGVSMDAGVMISSGRAGGVAAVTYPRNPIRLARIVAEKTPHIIMAGPRADELAAKLGLEKHPGPHWRSVERWKTARLKPPQSTWIARRIESAKALGYDTVGAVALDSNGCLAAGASTGGVLLKLPGRVGDSCIPGAGFYANGKVAASATGIGETIIMSMSSLRLAQLYEIVGVLRDAVELTVREHTMRWGPGTLGLIALSSRGEVEASYNTEAMPWASASLGEEPRVSGLPIA